MKTATVRLSLHFVRLNREKKEFQNSRLVWRLCPKEMKLTCIWQVYSVASCKVKIYLVPKAHTFVYNGIRLYYESNLTFET